MNRTGIIGAGIVGLAVARELTNRGTAVTVLEAADRLGVHQTGHNSGVVHAGLYYPPGSLKARLCTTGRELMRDYCAAKGIAYDEVGKVVVAVTEDELPRLDAIEERSRANGVPDLRRLDAAGLAEVEPHARGVAALHSPRTAVVDFVLVAAAYQADLEAAGGEVLFNRPVTAISAHPGGVEVTAAGTAYTFDRIVVCAGVGTDAMARAAGLPGDVRIVPFRGEYHRLRPEARGLVRGLIYPVPDPRYPFLGVHLTKRVDGEVLVGPNALLSLRDLAPRTAAWPGLWRLAGRHWRTGARELVGSLSVREFARQARRYVPELRAGDLIPATAGVRAQAVDRAGGLADDFRIGVSDRVTIVRNAPSPAATSSLAIAVHLVDRLTD